MCSRTDDPSMHDGHVLNPDHIEAADAMGDWAYHDANGKPLRGPCSDTECRYMSAPGGGDHDGAHSFQDGTTGYAHDYGQPCGCLECNGA